MGFLNSCWEALLRLTIFAQSHLELNQQPLPLPGVVVNPQHASKGFVCHYPSLVGWESCNTAHNRQCWIKDPSKKNPLWSEYSVATHYEEHTPPGITREYWLEVNEKPLSPDGYLKPLGKVFNDTYPGPLIEACWGDEIIVHVTNKLSDNGTTIHWHGIRQLYTNEMDGVNGVTQCPIAGISADNPHGDTFTYKFRAHQYGHTWYHSHYSLQYPDGVAGPLLIHGPTSANYDHDLTPVLINDWVHDTAFASFQQELSHQVPLLDSIVFNGTGHYNCTNTSDPACCSGTNPDPRCQSVGSYFETTFKKGKRYLLRLINASAEAMFIFSIDNHTMEVVSNDLVPIVPYQTDSLFIGIGQRYSVIVEANANHTGHDGNYWIRTRPAAGCGNFSSQATSALEKTGILRYHSSSVALPTTVTQTNRTNCTDEPYASLVPYVPWNVDPVPMNNITEYTFEAAFNGSRSDPLTRWELFDTPLYLDFANPTIENLENKTFLYEATLPNSAYAVVDYNYTRGYVYLVITGKPFKKNGPVAIPAAHPIHLHGHDFVILAQENSTYNESTAPAGFNYVNPPRRDVALLFAGGYLALAFKPDNPGIWLVHCHIAFHASSGLALQILERQDDILHTIGSLDATNTTCNQWKSWSERPVIDQEQNDSGI